MIHFSRKWSPEIKSGLYMTTFWGKDPVGLGKANRHQKKILLSVWWDYKGVVYFWVADTKTINSVVKVIQEKWRELANRKGRIVFHHDNARPPLIFSHRTKTTGARLECFGSFSFFSTLVFFSLKIRKKDNNNEKTLNINIYQKFIIPKSACTFRYDLSQFLPDRVNLEL